jgi:hypothetical protein
VDELGNEVTLKSVAELNIDANGGSVDCRKNCRIQMSRKIMTPENNEPEVPVN